MSGACDKAAERGVDARPLFSIIMPCYRVAAYLPSAIACIRAQTCADWELICVDDASPDNVAELVEYAAAEDPRIRLVRHKVNHGLADARNTGISAARGRYVWMPDPDDAYAPDLLERCAEKIRSQADAEARTDVVVFGLTEELFDADGSVCGAHDIVPALDGAFSGSDAHAQVLDLEDRTLLGYAWNKVYRAEVLDGIAFETVPLIEDIVFNVAVFNRVENLALVARPLYRYEKRVAANLTAKFVPEYYEVHRRRIDDVYRQQVSWGLDSADVRSRLGARYARYILSALERNCDARAGLNHAGRVAFCRSIMDDELFRALVLDACPQGRGARMCVGLLKTHSALVWCAAGRIIHLMRSRAGLAYRKATFSR